MFEEQAVRSPDCIALVYNSQYVTYRELNLRSNQLGNLLLENGLKPNEIVGIIAGRSIEMIIAIFGILKSGGAYLPIDPEYPEERINFILDDSKTRAIFSHSKVNIPKELEILIFDLNESLNYQNKQVHNIQHARERGLAYVIYTSGSTGKPKGVVVEHRSVVNLVIGLIYSIYENCKETLQFSLNSPIFFDASVKQIFPALILGHNLDIIPESIRLEESELIKHYIKHTVNIVDGTPFHAQMLIHHKDKIGQNIRVSHFILGGDELKHEIIQGLFDKFKRDDLKVINVYGPTECTDVTTIKVNTIESLKLEERLSIGKPISNYGIYILGKLGQLMPIGLSGEMYISGEGLSIGYLNNPELTKDKFINHPFKEGEKLYRTGDLARWLPDGNIEFQGRLDYQVKIRGFRIELGEIETNIQKHSDVDDVVVLAREDKEGDNYLCAYIVSKIGGEEFIESIREFITGLLPNYMLPSYFVELEKIPLTINGKIDRNSLPEPEIKAGSAYLAPKTLIETKLVKIWSEVLTIAPKEISTNVSFFELGGHSLKATVLVSRIHKELDVRLELRDVFQSLTVQAQAELINSSESALYFSIPKAKNQEYYPLSSSQRRLYFLQQMDLGSTAYNMPGLIDVPKGQDKHQITEVFHQLIARHENFRTSFEIEDELPVQRIHSVVSFSISDNQIISSELSKFRKDFVQAFDLSQAPLFRVTYLEVMDGDDLLLVDMHHIISDGRSHAILEEEFYQLIAGKELVPLRLQYKDYSEWQNSEEQQERIKGQESYWLNKFAGELPVLELPTDYSRSVMQSFEGASVGFILSAEETKIIHELCMNHGLTLYMTLLSVFTILLSKLSGQDDIIVGSPIAARRHADLEDVVGMFVNTLAIRSDVSGDKLLIDYLQELKENTLEAYENQEYQFEDLVKKVVSKRDTSRNPIFDVMFNLLEGVSQESQDVTSIALNHVKGISKFDLSLIVLDLGSELYLRFEYSTKLFSSETIERFINNIRQLIQGLSDKFDQRLKDLNILSEEEKYRLLYEFNETKIDYPKEKTIQGLFEDQVLRSPDCIAIVYGDKILTYSELNYRSNHLAKHLIDEGFYENGIVGIMINRSVDMVIGLLGILKSGNAYLPIDPCLPVSRVNYILKDSAINVLLSQDELIKDFDFSGEILNNNILLVGTRSSEISYPKPRKSTIAYLLYTSGSTGQPKGVLVGQSSVVNILHFLNSNYRYQSRDVFLLKTPFVFDVSVSELYTWFMSGSHLSILPEGAEKDAKEIIKNILIHQVSYINFVPSMFRVFVEYLKDENIDLLRLLKYVFLAGESLNKEHIEKFVSLAPDIKLENLYGPTETTVYSSYYSVNYSIIKNQISIGTGVSNTDLYILDRYNQIQAIGVSGELCISGVGLALGYLNNPELTVEKFIEHPYKEGELLYKTGDLSRWLTDGNIEFLGRLDHQVQLRGYRIELGEIESALLKLAGVKNAVVLDIISNSGEKYLCAYVVFKTKKVIENLRSYLIGVLPDYMVPSYFVEMEEIPLTINGKVNRKALPYPELKSGDNYVAPSNVIEEKLVEVWSKVLGIENIGVTDNFYFIGGNSINSIQICTIIQNNGYELYVKDILQYQTIQKISLLMKERLVLPISNKGFIKYKDFCKNNPKNLYMASLAQARIYFQQELNLTNVSYNIPVHLLIEGELDVLRVNEVISNLVIRHEALRTEFVVQENQLFQRIIEKIKIDVVPEELGNNEIDVLFAEFIKPFNLNLAPLFRVKLIKAKNNVYHLFLDFHHSITDFISSHILVKEFSQLYKRINIPLPKIQYRHYSEWHNSMFQEDKSGPDEKYWMNVFKDKIDMSVFPRDYLKTTSLDQQKGEMIIFYIENDLKKKLDNLIKDKMTTTFIFLLTVYNILHFKYTAQKTIVVGSTITGRSKQEFEQVVGMFVNMIAMKNDIREEFTFEELLFNIKQNALMAYKHQDYPINKLVNRLRTERKISNNELFTTEFAMNYLSIESLVASGLKFTTIEKNANFAKFDLHFQVHEKEDNLKIILRYSTEVFKRSTIERVKKHFMEILETVTENPIITLREISLSQSLVNSKSLMSLEDEKGFNL